MAPAADIRELLLHADWLRRLATHLVRDDDPADVVQQTWLAALRRPPASDRPARPWLAEVLRNFARRAHRDRLVRRRHQASEAEPPAAVAATASAQSLLEAAELQRLLAELVAALDEPYRSTILLRFYQGIEPTEIARSAGVPAGTVRWRVSEGVRRLRQALDGRESAGDWRRALLPLASAGAPAAPALNGGLLIMSTKAKLGIAAIAVAALAVGSLTWTVRSDRRRRSLAGASGEASRLAPAGSATEPEAPAAAASAVARAPATGGQQAPAIHARAPRQPPPRLLSAPLGAAPAPGGGSEQPRGTLDKEEIRRAMRRMIPTLKQCYVRLLEHQPQATGRLVFRFTITEDGAGGGRIADASILPQAADAGAPELIAPLTEQCMLNALTEAQFPAPQGGPVTVSYPFSFAPSGDMVPGTARPAPAAPP